MRKATPISSAKQRFKGNKELIRRIENLPPSFYEPQERDGQPAYYVLHDDIYLVFWCPLCLKWHIHGAGDGSMKYYGTRTPHCCKVEGIPAYYSLLKWDY